MDTRIGKFKISAEMIHKKPALVKKIMGECIIIEAVFRTWEPWIKYQAFCDQFDVLAIDEEVPNYSCSVSKFDDKVVVHFRRDD